MSFRLQHASVRHQTTPIEHPVKTAFATMTERHAVFVTLIDEDGATGVCESWVNFPTWAPYERIAAYERGLFPYFASQSIDGIPAAMAEAYRIFSGPAHQAGTIGPLISALAAIELALWDIAAQRAELPLAKLWFDEPQPRVRIYASGINSPIPWGLIDEHLELGVTRFKLKLGFGDEIDRENLTAIKRHLGDRAELAVDVNRGWSLEQARAWLPILADHDIVWLEEPLRHTEESQLGTLRGKVPIAAGENELMADATDRARVAAMPVDILQPDLTKYTLPHIALELLKTSARERIVPHFLGSGPGQAASLHYAAGCPLGWCEWDINRNSLRTDVCEPAFEIRDGCIELPETPGLGWALK